MQSSASPLPFRPRTRYVVNHCAMLQHHHFNLSRKADTIHAIISLSEMVAPTGETFDERELPGSDTGGAAGSGHIAAQGSGNDGHHSRSA
ncbi:hypothetical protein AGR4A_Cc80184 [Agrobacterium tumefaciens str. B6]|uniref:Uncharacterized protein n=1 Tax=Agrobacterium tumefaciens str. B6 TaxID=1183423 RepID=A0A822V5N5_AGRTU|nr:hypothetical protein AGR4A_Cc80184 [Agrobacterium tumefaciens str. B6]